MEEKTSFVRKLQVVKEHNFSLRELMKIFSENCKDSWGDLGRSTVASQCGGNEDMVN